MNQFPSNKSEGEGKVLVTYSTQISHICLEIEAESVDIFGHNWLRSWCSKSNRLHVDIFFFFFLIF